MRGSTGLFGASRERSPLPPLALAEFRPKLLGTNGEAVRLRGNRVEMRRRLPPGLSSRQKVALSQFFAGHISAGQLSRRLALSGPPRDSAVTRGALTSDVAPNRHGATSNYRIANRRLIWLTALLAIAAAGGVVGAVMASRSATAGPHSGLVGHRPAVHRARQIRGTHSRPQPERTVSQHRSAPARPDAAASRHAHPRTTPSAAKTRPRSRYGSPRRSSTATTAPASTSSTGTATVPSGPTTSTTSTAPPTSTTGTTTSVPSPSTTTGTTVSGGK